MIQVADSPGNRNDRQMNQVRIERRPTNFTDYSDAEETGHKAFAGQKRNQEKAIQQNRERMVEEIIEARVQFRTHQEEAAINGGKHHELSDTTCKISLEEIKAAFFKEPKEHHAEQVFKNTDGRKNVEETVLGIVTVEPEIVGKAEKSSPQNTRNKERSKKHPERTVTLLKEPTAKPGRYGVAHKEASKRPGRFIQLHAQIRHDRPGKGQMQKQTTPRMSHLGKASCRTVSNFI